VLLDLLFVQAVEYICQTIPWSCYELDTPPSGLVHHHHYSSNMHEQIFSPKAKQRSAQTNFDYMQNRSSINFCNQD
jgi:hypothetical protein